MRDFHQHPVDKAFADKLKEAQVKAPARVWEGVSAQMETQRLRKKVVYSQWTAAAAVALLIGFSSWYFIWGTVASGGIANSPANPIAKVKPAHKIERAPVAAKEIACNESGPRTKTTPQFVERIRFKTYIGKPVDIVPRRVSLTSFKQNALLREAGTDVATLFAAPSVVEVPQQQAIQPMEVNRDFMAEFVPQDEPGRKKNRHDFNIGGTIAPDFAFESQTPVSLSRVNYSTTEVLPENPENSSRSFTPVAAFTAGVNAGYEINDRISVNSGVLYTQRNTESHHGIYQKGKAELVTTKFDVSFLEVPATVQYEWLQRKGWSSYVATGVSATMFLYYENTFESSSGINARNVSDKSEAMNLAQTSMLMSAGVDVNLTEHVSLNVEPRLRYGLQTNPYAFTQSNPLSLAGFSGVSYKF